MMLRAKVEDVILVRGVDVHGYPNNIGSYMYGSEPSVYALPKRDVAFKQMNQDVIVNVYVTNEVAKKLDAVQSVTLTGEEVSIIANALSDFFPDRSLSAIGLIKGYINYKRNK